MQPISSKPSTICWWLVSLLNELGERLGQVNGPRIIVGQAIQHRGGNNGACGERLIRLIPVRYLLLEALMGARAIEILNLLPHKTMPLETMQNEHLVQTFPFQTTDEALAETIGRRGSGWCLQGVNTGVLEQA